MKKIKLLSSGGMDLHYNNAIKYHPFEPYNPKKDSKKPAMFWCYFPEDYEALAKHEGKKYVLWHGTDVLRFRSAFGKYINVLRNPEITHIFLNHITQSEMFQIGIYGEQRYIFWGDASKYIPETELTKDCYISSCKDRGQEYGEFILTGLAWKYPEWNFHIFGIEPTVPVYCDNVKYYGMIPEDEMDEITRKFGLCLRYNVHDGFPQVMCKALLREQFVLTQIPYKKMTVEFRSTSELFKAFDLIDKEINEGKTFKSTVNQQINNFDFIR